MPITTYPMIGKPKHSLDINNEEVGLIDGALVIANDDGTIYTSRITGVDYTIESLINFISVIRDFKNKLNINI